MNNMNNMTTSPIPLVDAPQAHQVQCLSPDGFHNVSYRLVAMLCCVVLCCVVLCCVVLCCVVLCCVVLCVVCCVLCVVLCCVVCCVLCCCDVESTPTAITKTINKHDRVWGPAQASDDVITIICCHGLTRNSRDFDHLASYLIQLRDHNSNNDNNSRPLYRVVTVDVVGRGESDELQTKTNYGYPLYCSDMTTLIARVTAGYGFLIEC